MYNYFSSRLNREIPFRRDGNTRSSMPWSKSYLMTPLSCDKSSKEMVLRITASSFDRKGKSLGPVERFKDVTVSLNAQAPMDVLEDAAHRVDRRFMSFFPRKEKPISRETLINTALQDLVDFRKSRNEALPLHESQEHVRRFLKDNMLVRLPVFYCDDNGIVRGRWSHGAETIWLNFPVQDLIGISIQTPKETGSGMIKMNAKLLHEDDIPYIASRLGIPLT